MYMYTVPGVAFTSGFYQIRGKCLVPKVKEAPPPPSENELYTNNLKGIVHVHVGYLIICFPLQIGSVPNESNTLIRHCRERGKERETEKR